MSRGMMVASWDSFRSRSIPLPSYLLLSPTDEVFVINEIAGDLVEIRHSLWSQASVQGQASGRTRQASDERNYMCVCYCMRLPY